MLQFHLKVMHVLCKVVLALLYVENTVKEVVLTQLRILLTQPHVLKTLSHYRSDRVE